MPLTTGPNVQVFAFNDTAVRALTIDGEPWWIARDVCAVLGISNVADALAALDDDEKGVATTDTPGGPQQMTTINEPGLYALTFRSRKRQAKDFKRWVTHTVLPALRKTGTYTAEPPTTVSWDQAAAIARLQYGLDVDTAGLRELLSKGGILTKELRPHRKWEHLFWPLANRWEIHAAVLPQLIKFAVTVRRQLAAAEQDLQMSLPLPISAMFTEEPALSRPPTPGADILRLPRTRRGDAS
jgi:prophage antirepressor-like protein